MHMDHSSLTNMGRWLFGVTKEWSTLTIEPKIPISSIHATAVERPGAMHCMRCSIGSIAYLQANQEENLAATSLLSVTLPKWSMFVDHAHITHRMPERTSDNGWRLGGDAARDGCNILKINLKKQFTNK